MPNVMAVQTALRTSAAPRLATSGQTWSGVETHTPDRRSSLWHSEKRVEMSSVPPCLAHGLVKAMAAVKLRGDEERVEVWGEVVSVSGVGERGKRERERA